MIFDSVKNIGRYSPILHHLEAGLAAVKALTSYEVGRYEFEGGYFKIQKGNTLQLEAGDYEAHRKYVDVQILLEGREQVVWTPLEKTSFKEYLDDRDMVICSAPVDQVITIEPGMFWVAFPDDAHKSCRHVSDQSSYVKVLLKLPID